MPEYDVPRAPALDPPKNRTQNMPHHFVWRDEIPLTSSTEENGAKSKPIISAMFAVGKGFRRVVLRLCRSSKRRIYDSAEQVARLRENLITAWMQQIIAD